MNKLLFVVFVAAVSFAWDQGAQALTPLQTAQQPTPAPATPTGNTPECPTGLQWVPTSYGGYCVAGQRAESQAPTQSNTDSIDLAPLVSLPQPDKYALAFVPLVKGNDSYAFLVSPSGKLGTTSSYNLLKAYQTGYRPFTVADLLAITSAVADEEKNLQRRIKELSEDYDALAARYNRLAQVSSTPQVQSQPAVDERQMVKAMLFQGLLQRTFPEPPGQINVNVRTVDCTKFPALCVGH